MNATADDPDVLHAVYLRSSARGPWVLLGVYEDRDAAWSAIHGIRDKRARCWLTTVPKPKPVTDPTKSEVAALTAF